MIRSKAVYAQRFHMRHAQITVSFLEGYININCGEMPYTVMKSLLDELIYDGYAGSGDISDEGISLYSPDPWMCGEESLKEIIQAKMESMNYEVTFLS